MYCTGILRISVAPPFFSLNVHKKWLQEKVDVSTLRAQYNHPHATNPTLTCKNNVTVGNRQDVTSGG